MLRVGARSIEKVLHAEITDFVLRKIRALEYDHLHRIARMISQAPLFAIHRVHLSLIFRVVSGFLTCEPIMNHILLMQPLRFY